MPTHQSLQRAIAVLRQFTEREPALTVSEISRRLGLHKSTVSRLLTALAEEGMVWQDSTTARYSLGIGVVELAGVALGQIDVRAAAMPHIDELAAGTGETVSVVVPRHDEGVTVAYVASPHPIRHVVWIGRRMPLASTAVGRAILAAQHAAGRDWRDAIAARAGQLPSVVERDLSEALAGVAERGYAVEIDEYEPGTTVVAAPVLDRIGDVVAAISVSGPSERFGDDQREQAIPRLIVATNRVAENLGVLPVAALAGGLG